MEKYIFFDTTWNQILRVGGLVAKEIKRISDSKVYGLVYETSGKNVDSSKGNDIFDDYLITTRISEVESFINKVKPTVVVFAQNSMPDIAAIFFSRKIGARVVMMQHGLIYDGASLDNVRIGEIIAAIKMAKKTLSYFGIMRYICNRENKSFTNLIRNILKNRTDVRLTVQYYFDPPLIGDNAFVIGEYWRGFYNKNYGYVKDGIYVMGNHDLDDLDDNAIKEDAICYIPSVHVEDGKVKLSVFNDFLACLRDSIPEGVKLYIKLHPRSNKAIYTNILGEDNIEYISGKELPYVNTYIGHNSSLLSKALQISGKIVLWGFKEEPELFYKDIAYAVCHDGGSLRKAVSEAFNDKSYGMKDDIERFSYKNPQGAYNYCAVKLLEINNK